MARNGNGSAEPKKPTQYHIFTETEDGTLNPLGQYEGRNAEEAVGAYLTDNDSDGAEETFVIIPERNLTRVSVEVETVQKVRLSAA